MVKRSGIELDTARLLATPHVMIRSDREPCDSHSNFVSIAITERTTAAM
ncbi:hypothetical protein ACFW9U_27980 [Rhodococcus aetherivorans]